MKLFTVVIVLLLLPWKVEGQQTISKEEAEAEALFTDEQRDSAWEAYVESRIARRDSINNLEWIAEEYGNRNRLPLYLKPNTQYRVIWHEIVPLVGNCRWVNIETFPTGREPDDSGWIHSVIEHKQFCDTIGFRPTVIEYKEITGEQNGR